MPVPDSITKNFEATSEFLHLETDKPKKFLFNNFGTDGQGQDFIKTYIKDFNGKENAVGEFQSVTDLDNQERGPKKFSTTSKTLIRKLYGFFDRGNLALEITRTGEGFETDYDIYPLTPTRLQEQVKEGKTNDETTNPS